jgi:hypothetical protein
MPPKSVKYVWDKKLAKVVIKPEDIRGMNLPPLYPEMADDLQNTFSKTAEEVMAGLGVPEGMLNNPGGAMQTTSTPSASQNLYEILMEPQFASGERRRADSGRPWAEEEMQKVLRTIQKAVIGYEVVGVYASLGEMTRWLTWILGNSFKLFQLYWSILRDKPDCAIRVRVERGSVYEITSKGIYATNAGASLKPADQFEAYRYAVPSITLTEEQFRAAMVNVPTLTPPAPGLDRPKGPDSLGYKSDLQPPSAIRSDPDIEI